ncbi:MAG: hypothetical protein EPN48_11650 [Microbacteriaceae bacterium]|nr:MAG: hypothetical protein EPN48_11650 [Microbacteriaceae bacterium]
MSQVFYALAILACPVGMGLMMWLMMRTGKKKPAGTTPSTATEAEVAQLRADLDRLRASQTLDVPVDIVDRPR